MAWILAIALILLLIAITRACVINAIALKRDINTRFEDFRAKLEREANATVGDFLQSNSEAVISSASPGGVSEGRQRWHSSCRRGPRNP
jgi:hypothetical protein